MANISTIHGWSQSSEEKRCLRSLEPPVGSDVYPDPVQLPDVSPSDTPVFLARHQSEEKPQVQPSVTAGGMEGGGGVGVEGGGAQSSSKGP